MTARVTRAVLAASVALVVSATTASAQPAPSGRISDILVGASDLQLLFAGRNLPGAAALDPTSVRVEIDGTAVPATARLVTAGTVRRTAVLAIDTSGSMAGAGITGAKAAAQAFLDAAPADVEVGLVTFADSARVAVAPTTDRAALRAAVSSLAAAGETSLYDAVLLAVRAVAPAGAASVLVLSDGADTTSTASLPSVVAGVRSSRVAVDAVAFRTTASVTAALSQIAGAARGRVVSAAGVADIGRAFTATAAELTNQLVVTVALAAERKSGQATVTVSALAGPTTVTDSAVTLLTAAPPSQSAQPAGPIAVEPRDTPLGSTAALVLALLAVFIGLGGAAAAVFVIVSDRETGRVRRRLSGYTPGQHLAIESGVAGESAVARSAMELAGRFVAKRGIEVRLNEKLEGAGIPLRAAEWLLVQAGSTVGMAVLLFLLTGGGGGGALLGLLVGAAGPVAFLAIKSSRRESAFLAQLPDTLQLVSGSLSAGYSFPQAIDTVVREGAQPISGEFAKAIVDARLGVPMEDALSTIAERMHSDDFSWVVMAVRIQREVGGNLAEVLSNVAATMRERERLRRQVRVLSAEGRLSAWILGLLPVMFAMYLVTVRPGYLAPLFTDPLGVVLLGFMVVSLLVGAFWLRKVVRVDV